MKMKCILALITFISIISKCKVKADEENIYNEPTYVIGPRYDLWSWYHGWVSKGYGDNPLDYINICTFHRVPESHLRVCKINLFLRENVMIKCPSSKTYRGIIYPRNPGYHYTDLTYIEGEIKNGHSYVEKLPPEVITERLDRIDNGDVLVVKYIKHGNKLKGVNFVCENHGENNVKSDYENLSMVISISFDEYRVDNADDVSNYIITNSIALRNNYLQWKNRDVDVEVEMLPFYNFNIYCNGLLDYRLHDVPGLLHNETLTIKNIFPNPSVFPFTRKYQDFDTAMEIGGFQDTSKKGVYINGSSIRTKGFEMELYLSTNLHSIVLPFEFVCKPSEDDTLPGDKTQTFKLKFPTYSLMPKCTRITDSTESVPTILINDVLHCPIDIDKYPLVVVSGGDDSYLFNQTFDKSEPVNALPTEYEDYIVTILSKNARLVNVKALYRGNSVIYNPNFGLEFWNYPLVESGISRDISTLEKKNLILLNSIRKCEFKTGNQHCVTVLKPFETLEIDCNTLYPPDLTRVYTKNDKGEFIEKLLSDISTGLKRLNTGDKSILFYSRFGSFVGNTNKIFLSCDPLHTTLRGGERLVEIFLGFNSIENSEKSLNNKTRYISAAASNIKTIITCPKDSPRDSIKYSLLPESISEGYYNLLNLNDLDRASKGPIGNAIGMTDYKVDIQSNGYNNDIIITRPRNHITAVGSSPQVFYICKPQDKSLDDLNNSTIIELSFRPNVESIRICGNGFNNIKPGHFGKPITRCKHTFYINQKSVDISHYTSKRKEELLEKLLEKELESKIVKEEKVIVVKEEEEEDKDGKSQNLIAKNLEDALFSCDGGVNFDQLTEEESRDYRIRKDFKLTLHKIGELESYFDFPLYEMDSKDVVVNQFDSTVQDLDLDSFINKYNEINNTKRHNTPIGMICPIGDDKAIKPICTAVKRGTHIFSKSIIIPNFFYRKESGYSQSLWLIDYERWERITSTIKDIDYTSCTCKGRRGEAVTTLEIRGSDGSTLVEISLFVVFLFYLV